MGERGQGRKPLPEDQKGKGYSVRLTPARIEKLKRLGGAQWLSQKIDEAEDKPSRPTHPEG